MPENFQRLKPSLIQIQVVLCEWENCLKKCLKIVQRPNANLCLISSSLVSSVERREKIPETSPPLERTGFYRSTRHYTRFQFLGIQKHFSDYDIHKETHFSLKSDFMVDVRFELTTNDPCFAVVAICEGLSPLG